MKNKKILAVGLCGAICLSLAGFTYANALAWTNEQKNEMEALIGTGDGWYDGQGVFHEFTQESVDAMIASYKETLESIKMEYCTPKTAAMVIPTR